MARVIKKGGKGKQAFVPAKLKRSVERAAKEAGLSSSKVKQLVKEVVEPVVVLARKKRTIKAADLRRSLLGRLERRAKKVVTAWKRFEKKK